MIPGYPYRYPSYLYRYRYPRYLPYRYRYASVPGIGIGISISAITGYWSNTAGEVKKKDRKKKEFYDEYNRIRHNLLNDLSLKEQNKFIPPCFSS